MGGASTCVMGGTGACVMGGTGARVMGGTVVGGAMPCDNTDLSPQGRCPWDHRSSEEAWV